MHLETKIVRGADYFEPRTCSLAAPIYQDSVDASLENETIVIKKASHKKHRTTKERLVEFYRKDAGASSTNMKKQKEVDWGPPVGKETW
jgi:antitoxin component of MazEF toxin-antitoxin module